MEIIDRWHRRREEAWWERHRRETRWNALADYNTRVSKGIVHTPEFVALMVEEQAAFDREHGQTPTGFPVTLEGTR